MQALCQRIVTSKFEGQQSVTLVCNRLDARHGKYPFSCIDLQFNDHPLVPCSLHPRHQQPCLQSRFAQMGMGHRGKSFAFLVFMGS